jgi:hypothetical protein
MVSSVRSVSPSSSAHEAPLDTASTDATPKADTGRPTAMPADAASSAQFSGLKSRRASESGVAPEVAADTAGKAASSKLRKGALPPKQRPGSPGSTRTHESGARDSIELNSLSRTDSVAASDAGSQVDAASQAGSDGDDEIRLKLPDPCGGQLTLDAAGNLHCEQDHGVQAVLDLIRELDPAAVQGLDIPPGARIEIGWDEDLMAKMAGFQQFVGGGLSETTGVLRKAIAEGESAFPEHTRMPGTNQHPGAYLRDIGIQIRITPDTGAGARLQAALTQPHADPAKNARLQKFRGDFGAMSLLSLAVNKDFNKELAYGFGASLVGTGAIGAAFDYGIWPAVKSAMSPEAVAKFGPLIDSITPLFAETFDSMVIKRLMEAMKGGKFMPESFASALGDLKDAAFSGSIAAIGSIPNNFVRDLASAARDAGHPQLAIGLLVAKQVTNLLATWTSGAMVPLEVMSDHKALVESNLAMIEAGKIARPDVEDLHKYVSDEALNTLRAARGTGSAIRSMATGGEIAATLGLTLSLLEHYGLISSSVEQLITLMYSTPTEVISMLSTMGAEKLVGVDSSKPEARITTDAAKQSGLLGQIARSDATTLADLDHIARPYGERNAQLGYSVTLALGGAMGIVEKGTDFAKDSASALGRGVLALPGAAYQHALKPVGQGVAWTAQKTAGALAPVVTPVLTPLGKAMLAGASAAGTYVVSPAANATAVAVDSAVRVPEAGARLVGRAAASGTDALSSFVRARRQRTAVEPSGDDMV